MKPLFFVLAFMLTGTIFAHANTNVETSAKIIVTETGGASANILEDSTSNFYNGSIKSKRRPGRKPNGRTSRNSDLKLSESRQT